MRISRTVLATAIISGMAGYGLGTTRLVDSLSPELGVPHALASYATAGRSVHPLPIDSGLWRAWEIRPASGPSQLAFGMPGSDAVVVGDLIDGSGENIGTDRLFTEIRQRFQFHSLEFQAKTVSANAESPSIIATDYVVADPLDANFQQHAQRVFKLAESGYPLRFIPIVSAEVQSQDPLSSSDSFDALQIIFSAATHKSGKTPYQELKQIATGSRIERPAGSSIATDRYAFEAITKNLKISNWLGLTDHPYVVSQGTEEGITVTPLAEWLEKIELEPLQGENIKRGRNE